MNNATQEQFIFKAGALPEAVFTAAATGVLTSNAHGLSDGDCLWVTTATTLPAGLAASTNYYVIEATTNTFKLSATLGGPAVTIGDEGTGEHTFHLKGKKIYIGDWVHVVLGVYSTGNFAATLKVQVSNQEDVDFGKAKSATNRWDYAQIKLSDTGATTNGATGIVASGTDLAVNYELNTNYYRYLSANFTAYSAGSLNMTASMANNC